MSLQPDPLLWITDTCCQVPLPKTLGSLKRKIIRVPFLRIALLLLLVQPCGCHLRPQNQSAPDPARDINTVLREHDDRLMSISGVTGVYVGLEKDGRTPCLKVMAVRKTAALRKKIPKYLEGYRVLVEETGIIKPLSAPEPRPNKS